MHGSPRQRRPATRPARAVAACVLFLLLAACSPYKVAGDQLMKFSKNVIMPHELAGTDIGIGCRAVMAWTAPGISFENVGTDVNQIAILLYLTSGVCNEFHALESELTFLRAMHAQQPLAGQDARTAQKRALAVSAARQYAGYKRFIAHYGVPREGHCPTFKTDFDELVFMIGLLSGVQAMVNDAQTGQFVSVPRDIAPSVNHMVKCINSDKWWDLPLGVQAALWHVAPMFAPDGVEPMEILERVAIRGEKDGVRLGHVIWAMAALNSGDTATAKRAIREFVAAGDRFTRSDQYRILDVIANDIMLAISDRIWSEQAGYRTPMLALGTFPDDPPRLTPGGIDDLLP